MKKTRRLALILIFTLLLSSLMVTPSAAASASGGNLGISFSSHTDGDYIKGKFNYSNTVFHSGGAYDFIGEWEYYYSDSYFQAPSDEYNSHLATMSFSLCMSAFSEFGRTPSAAYDNAEALLSGLGFYDIETNAETDYPPREDTIGIVMAKKEILDGGRPYTVVSITVRSGGYGSEWASNFLVGDGSLYDGNHRGFYEARDRALVFISDYLQRNAEGDTKLWISGYSRGGAVAGILGAWFDDNLSETSSLGIALEHEDIFTYTFEAPTSTDKKNLVGKNYTNIFNIYNPADIVTYLPFSGSPRSGWNFARPGVECPFDRITAEEAEELNAVISSITPYAVYDIHNFTSIISALGKTQDKFLGGFFGELALRIDRAAYAERIEGPLTEIIGNIMGRSNAELYETVCSIVDGIASDLKISREMSVIDAVQLIGALMANDTSASSVLSAVGNNLVRFGVLSEYNDDVRAALSALISAVAKNDSDGTNLLLYVANIALNTTSIPFDEEHTISNNRIVEAHLPEIVLGMLIYFDEAYSEPQGGYSEAPSGREIVEVNVVIDGVSYSSCYYEGDTVTLSAKAPGCVTLGGYMLDGVSLSDGAEYSFTVSGDITLSVPTETDHFAVTDWIVESEPTLQSAGLRYKLCTACGSHISEERIPPLDSDLDGVPQLSGESFPVGAVTAAIVSGIFILTSALIFILRRIPQKTTEDKE